MNTQILTNPTLRCNPVIASLLISLSSTRPVQACSRDYGFDFDEDEIGRELLAPLPASLSSKAFPEIEADEFEQVLQCFLS